MNSIHDPSVFWSISWLKLDKRKWKKHVSSKRKLKRLKIILPIFDLNISSERHFQKKALKITTAVLHNTRVREGGRQKCYFSTLLFIEIKCALYKNSWMINYPNFYSIRIYLTLTIRSSIWINGKRSSYLDHSIYNIFI